MDDGQLRTSLDRFAPDFPRDCFSLKVVISQCISIRANGMMDSFMVRYNHYSQSVIRSQLLGKQKKPCIEVEVSWLLVAGLLVGGTHG